jgi:hypothetical protein
MRKRVLPSSGGGYDFHKRFRQLSHSHLVDGAPLPDVIALANAITSLSERTSAVAALSRLALWRTETAGPIIGFSPVAFESPSHLFKVKFDPDFGVLIHGKPTAIHLWNTKTVELAPGATYAALALVAQAYESQDGGPEDVGVLSMHEPPTLYLLSQVSDPSVAAASIVDHIEDIIQGTTSPPPPPEDHPFA